MLPTITAEKSVNESSGYWVFAGGVAGIFSAEPFSFFGACSFDTFSAGVCACIHAARLQINRMARINRTISFSPSFSPIEGRFTETRLDDATNITEKKPRRKSTWLVRNNQK